MLNNKSPVVPIRTPEGSIVHLPARSGSEQEPDLQVLRLRDVLERIPFSEAQLYKLIAAGLFPKSFALGPRAKGWLESSIDAWVMSRMEARVETPRLEDPVELPLWTPEMELIVPCRRGLRLMRMDAVVSRVRFGKTAIYDAMGEGEFPLPVAIGLRARAWVVHETNDWIRARYERRLKDDPGFAFLTCRSPGSGTSGGASGEDGRRGRRRSRTLKRSKNRARVS